jgi:hypothetical protein
MTEVVDLNEEIVGDGGVLQPCTNNGQGCQAVGVRLPWARGTNPKAKEIERESKGFQDYGEPAEPM